MPVFGQSGRNSAESDLTTSCKSPYRYQTKRVGDHTSGPLEKAAAMLPRPARYACVNRRWHRVEADLPEMYIGR
jgi:hypothetical protein